MSVIQRPTKQGNATTYQGKVAAGYTKILASEVDADLDLIYSAWNQGVDTTNIKDGSITGSKLAPGAVGTRELQDGGIATVDLADGAVTTPKIGDGQVTPAKIAPGGVPPGGEAGGDLTGVYPQPSLGVIQSGVVHLGYGAQVAAAANFAELGINLVGSPGADAGKPSWLLKIDAGNDGILVFRAPPGSTTFTTFLVIDAAGVLHASLPAGSIGRNELAPNGINGVGVTATSPSNFSVPTPNTWTTFVTLPPLTTRGGNVHLHGNPNLTVSGPPSGAVCSTRWTRGGTQLLSRSFAVSCPSLQSVVPLPGMTWVDNPPAGTYTYAYQVTVATGVTMISSGFADGMFLALEIG